MSRRTTLWLEFWVICLAYIAPPLITQLVPRHAFGTGAMAEVARSVTYFGECAVIIFIIWRSGDGLSRFGIRSDNALRFACTACLLLVATLSMVMFFRHLPSFPLPRLGAIEHRGSLGMATLLLSLIAASASEELIFRCYIITRLEELLGHRYYAVICSALIFSMVHAFRGSIAIVGAGLMALLFGFVFVRTRSISPMIAAHSLHNIVLSLSI